MSARSRKGENLTVALRPIAMRMTVEFVAPEAPELSMVAPGAATLFRLFKRHGGDSVEHVRLKLPRIAALDLVDRVLQWAGEQELSHLRGLRLSEIVPGLTPLPDGPIDGPPPNPPRKPAEIPSSGEAALVEVVRDIFTAAVRQGGGRPMRVDPLFARETLAEVRQGHKRAVSRRQPSPVEKAAYRLGVSVDTVERALPAGRDAENAIRAAVKSLPQGTAPLYAQVDYDKKEVVLTAGLASADKENTASIGGPVRSRIKRR